jgi:hypothetical protein
MLASKANNIICTLCIHWVSMCSFRLGNGVRSSLHALHQRPKSSTRTSHPITRWNQTFLSTHWLAANIQRGSRWRRFRTTDRFSSSVRLSCENQHHWNLTQFHRQPLRLREATKTKESLAQTKLSMFSWAIVYKNDERTKYYTGPNFETLANVYECIESDAQKLNLRNVGDPKTSHYCGSSRWRTNSSSRWWGFIRTSTIYTCRYYSEFDANTARKLLGPEIIQRPNSRGASNRPARN